MSYRPYSAPQPLLIGYDPFRDLPPDHLARLVDQVVDETVKPPPRPNGPGQPAYDPRLCVKVLVYGYATGVRSSRRLEQACRENLAFLYLTRGDTPSYGTLCTVRTEQGDFLEDVWQGLFAVAAAVGLERVGRIVVDSTKIRADVSPEAILKRSEFGAVQAELKRIVAEAERADAHEATDPPPRGQVAPPPDQMREILRRVRKELHASRKDRGAGAAAAGAASASPAPGDGSASLALPLGDLPSALAPVAPPAPEAPAAMTPKMLQRIKLGIDAITAALADGRKHLALTDPDARMMGEGREKNIRECHAWEIAVDGGLLVVGQTMQETNDNARLLPLVAAAEKQEPGGVQAVDADCGYFRGDDVAALALRGIDTCIPNSNTAGDLHRGQAIGTIQQSTRGKVPFEYDPAANLFRCPEGNELVATQQRQSAGQLVTVYRAQEPCTDRPLASQCLTNPQAKHRTLKVGEHQELLEGLRQRFADPEHVARYHRRGDAVETVFGFLRGTLGYVRWMLRGKEKVECEGRLFNAAYQFRKVQTARRKAALAVS